MLSGSSLLRRGGGTLAYVAATLALLLRTRPGRVGIDTKQYLFLDPGGYLADATTMWQPEVAFGTVPHQNVGFLWPVGPFFWLGEVAGLPDWVTQRLWIASLLIAAGLGVRALARHLGIGPAGAWAAALVYAWGPYTLGYVHRTSVLLLPWAGLGWMVLLASRAVRRGGWRDPAAFALVAVTVGGANATAFLLAGLAPLLWVIHQALDPDVGWRPALRASLRIGLLTAGVSLWWAVALAVQGGYSLNVLRYSETIDAVARSTTAPEVLRGLGYWLFYGRDRLAPYIEPAPPYQTSALLLAVTFALPLLGAVALIVVRGRHRSFCASLLLLGTVLAIGAYPWDDPSPLGSLFRMLAEDTEFGLALRSSSRAVPLISLGLALPIGALVTAAGRRWQMSGSTVPTVAWAGAALVAILALAAFPPLWRGTLVAEELSRPEELPDHWYAAAEWLDAQPHDTRILEVPGIDLTFHRWGAVWEPVTPGLTDRPFAARELIPYGGPGSVDLLRALDRRMQEGTIEPEAVAPIARLLRAGDVVLRSDLEYERFRTPRPRVLWDVLTDAPGLGAAVEFGAPTPNVAGPELPLLDEIELGIPTQAPHPPPVAAFPVEDPRTILHASSLRGAVVVAGSGEGLVDAAAAGLLDDPALVVYAASLLDRPELRDRLLDAGAELLITDSNRKRAERWRTLHDNTGLTEAADEEPLIDDPSDARLDLFPDAGDDSRSVTVTTGARATATAYGNPITYTPAHRPQRAIDGDPSTAWTVGAFGDPRGERLVIELDQRRPITRLEVLPADTEGRRLGRVGVVIDGRDVGSLTFDSGDAETIELPGGSPIGRIEMEILGTEPPTASTASRAAVGIAEVTIPGVQATEAVRLPVQLLSQVGDDLDHRLVVLLARQRSDPAEAARADEEKAMARVIELPSERSFGLTGTARLSARTSDAALWAIVGDAGPMVTASDTLPGDVASRPWSALDGEPETAWQTGFGPQEGRWIEAELGSPTTIDHLDLEVVTDDVHSVPTRLTISAGGESRNVELEPPTSGARGATSSTRVEFPPLRGDRIRVTVDAVAPRVTRDWYQLADVVMPVGIVELGLPGVAATELREAVSSMCRTDLLTVEGRPVGVRLAGSMAQAIRGHGFDVSACDPGAVSMGPGPAEVETAPGTRTGIDLDRLVLASGAGGGAADDHPAAALGRPSQPTPGVSRVDSSDIEHDLLVDTGGEDTMLVLGQNRNDGWHAAADGVDLGEPVLVDGYANGWVVPGADEPVGVTLTWRPQRLVTAGLLASGLAVLVCLGLVIAGTLRTRDEPATDERSAPPVLAAAPPNPTLGWPAALSWSFGAGALALVVSHPVTALVVAATALAAVRLRRGAALLGVAGIGSLALAFGLVVVGQRRNRWPADFDWPTHFDTAHHVAVLGVLLLVAGVARGQLRSADGGPR